MKTCPKCGELLGDSVRVCFNCDFDFVLKKVLNREQVTNYRIEEEKRIEQHQITIEQQQEQQREKQERQREARERQYKKNPLFEYKTVVVNDNTDGTINGSELQKMLDLYATNGWRLHSAFTNELGKSIGPGGPLKSNLNATLDQTILIFERCIKSAG